MVRALNHAARVPVAPLAQARPAVTAHVVERVYVARLVAHDDQALARDRREEIVPGPDDSAFVTHAVPLASKDAGLLGAERAVR